MRSAKVASPFSYKMPMPATPAEEMVRTRSEYAAGPSQTVLGAAHDFPSLSDVQTQRCARSFGSDGPEYMMVPALLFRERQAGGATSTTC